MKLANKIVSSALLIVTCLALAACSGVPGGNSSHTGSSTGTGSFTIGGAISGLTGTGLTLLDNSVNSLTVLPGPQRLPSAPRWLAAESMRSRFPHSLVLRRRLA